MIYDSLYLAFNCSIVIFKCKEVELKLEKVTSISTDSMKTSIASKTHSENQDRGPTPTPPTKIHDFGPQKMKGKGISPTSKKNSTIKDLSKAKLNWTNPTKESK